MLTKDELCEREIKLMCIRLPEIIEQIRRVGEGEACYYAHQWLFEPHEREWQCAKCGKVVDSVERLGPQKENYGR